MANHNSHHSMRSLLQTNAYIDGHWIPLEQRFQVLNPATGEVLADVADADATLTERAIDAAHKALPSWRVVSSHAR